VEAVGIEKEIASKLAKADELLEKAAKLRLEAQAMRTAAEKKQECALSEISNNPQTRALIAEAMTSKRVASAQEAKVTRLEADLVLVEKRLRGAHDLHAKMEPLEPKD